MLLIDCPYCGPRDEEEFSCGGEAHIMRPPADAELTDRQFGEYLFLRDNPKGLFLERWHHSAGCRRWFNMLRDTVSHDIIEIYAMGSTPKSKLGKQAFQESWRRNSAAELASTPQKRKKSSASQKSAQAAKS